MVWGTFTNVHIGTLAFALVFTVALYNMLVRKSRRIQVLFLFFLSLVVMGIAVYNTVTSENIIENLPLSMWGLAAILLPYAALFRKKWCCNLLLLWSSESLITLIFNQSRADWNVISPEFVIFFMTHTMIIAITLVLFWLKLVVRDFKYMFRSLLATTLVYTLAHFVNIAFGTNYFYSVNPEGIELLAFFRALIPMDYWYMYLTIPVFLIYLTWWYLPEILDYIRKTKRLRRKLRSIDKYYDEYEDEYIEEIIEEKYGR